MVVEKGSITTGVSVTGANPGYTTLVYNKKVTMWLMTPFLAITLISYLCIFIAKQYFGYAYR